MNAACIHLSPICLLGPCPCITVLVAAAFKDQQCSTRSLQLPLDPSASVNGRKDGDVPRNAGVLVRSLAVLAVMTAACTKSEDNKQAFMDDDIGQSLLDFLLHSQEPESVKAASQLIVKLTTADDIRPVVSRSVIPATFSMTSEAGCL